jgi:hypothetical protein
MEHRRSGTKRLRAVVDSRRLAESVAPVGFRRYTLRMPSIARIPAVRLAAFVLAGFIYGLAVSHIPSPSTVGVFWVSNLSAPWLLLAFLAGWSQRSRLWAAAAGALTDVAAIAGFYLTFLLIDPTTGRPDGPTSILTRIVGGMGYWLGWVVPTWETKAVLAGLVFGLLGWWWGRSRSLLAGAAVCLAFVLEPVAWALYDGHLPRPAVLSIAGAAIGLATLALVLASRRGARAAV